MAPSPSERWNRIRGEVELRDLLLDMGGKFLIGLGIGMMFEDSFAPYAWTFVVIGLGLSGVAKAKYWKRFWA